MERQDSPACSSLPGWVKLRSMTQRLGLCLEGVKFTSPGNLHRTHPPRRSLTPCSKGWPAWPPSHSRLCRRLKPLLQRPLAAARLGGSHRHHGGRQTLGFHCDVTLDVRNPLARVTALLPCRVRALYALRVHTSKARLRRCAQSFFRAAPG